MSQCPIGPGHLLCDALKSAVLPAQILTFSSCRVPLRHSPQMDDLRKFFDERQARDQCGLVGRVEYKMGMPATVWGVLILRGSQLSDTTQQPQRLARPSITLLMHMCPRASFLSDELFFHLACACQVTQSNPITQCFPHTAAVCFLHRPQTLLPHNHSSLWSLRGPARPRSRAPRGRA